jgi:hypothetical protein
VLVGVLPSGYGLYSPQATRRPFPAAQRIGYLARRLWSAPSAVRCNYPTGSSGHEVFVFEESVPLAAGKTIEAVILPSPGDVAGYNAALHIFALAVG